MKKTIKYILEKDGSHFQVKTYKSDRNTRVHLIPSKYGNWTPKGLASKWKLVDDDSGTLVITNKRDGVEMKLDYSQLADLNKLIQEYNVAINCWDKYQTIKVKR